MTKGWGFITLHDGSPDVFVHQVITRPASQYYTRKYLEKERNYIDIYIKAACLYTFLFVVRIFTGVVKDGSQNVAILIQAVQTYIPARGFGFQPPQIFVDPSEC